MDPGTLGLLFTGISSIAGGVGAAAGNKHSAQQAKNAATTGRIQADQIDASYRDELTSTINNIRAIRATTGAVTDSPTGQAIEAENIKTSDRNRSRDVASKRIQANQSDQDARFYNSSAKASLFGGVAKSLPSFFGM